MISLFRQSFSTLLLFTVVVVPALPQSAPGPDGIVSAGDPQHSVVAASPPRQTDLAQGKIDSAENHQANSVLSDEQSPRLDAQSKKAPKDVIAGKRKRRLAKYAVLGAATTVIVWLIASHRAT
jgi:hypothetical protein